MALFKPESLENSQNTNISGIRSRLLNPAFNNDFNPAGTVSCRVAVPVFFGGTHHVISINQ